MTHLTVSPIRALKDNYIWMLRKNGNFVAIVDPGEANPVIEILEKEGLILSAIFLTHHHGDHTGGVEVLVKKYNPKVFWAKDQEDNQEIIVEDMGIQFKTLKIPGHTLDHTAYYGHGVVFTGDTLFAAGCGRVFEGTPAQMVDSLKKLSSLPDETLVYCGHEYTQANLRFAKMVEPHNPDTVKIPSTIAAEKKANPFLRCHLESVRKAVEAHVGHTLSNPVEVFAALREWKNQA